MMSVKYPFLVFLLVFVCSSCDAATVSPVISEKPTKILLPTATIHPTLTLTPTLIPMPSKGWNYKIVYQKENFVIREAYWGPIDWATFVMPPARIRDASIDYNPSYYANKTWCSLSQSATGQCTETFQIKKLDGTEDKYEFQCKPPTMYGFCNLLKNGKFVWNGHMNGGIGDPINSIKQIGDEIAISYMSSVHKWFNSKQREKKRSV